MLEQDIAQEPQKGVRVGTFLCLHGHFYQPPRENPFTELLLTEPGATPYPNFNEKITAECYRPNAEIGNFDEISYDFGPTLATWLEKNHPDVHWRIIKADQHHRKRYGVGNAMAQAYNHTILPLASTRDKRTQIRWGLDDFRHRYGYEAHGMWLAETAVDLESLSIMAEEGVTYTVLAPWQAAEPIDPTDPYLVRLPNGRSITVFFYNAPLSGGVSFDWNITSNADIFVADCLTKQLIPGKQEAGRPQLVLIATDGELYGHHKPWRDKFLAHLIRYGAPDRGFQICTLERYLRMFPATREVRIHAPSAWSCGHGVARWESGCECTEGDGRWKGSLRRALSNLADRGNSLFERYTGEILKDPWKARNAYLGLRNGWIDPEHFWEQHGQGGRPEAKVEWRTLLLLEAQYYHQYSFTSCGFFFEDLDRIEPGNDIAFARRAISLTWQALGIDLQWNFLEDLRHIKSWRTGLTGALLYERLPIVASGMLPP